MRRLAALAFVAVLGLPVGTPLVAQADAGQLDLASLIPDGMFELSDVAVFRGSGGGVTAIATTTLINSPATVLVSMAPGTGNARRLIFALQPRDWSLSRAFPALANPVLDDLPFSNVGVVISNQNVAIPSSALSDDEWQFYREIYKSDEFVLRLTPGLNLIAAFPVEGLPAGHPLLAVMDALGIERGTILLQGTLGRSLTMLRGGVSAAALKDIYLRAELPPMRPPGSPGWFRSGQLALEITGEPSIRLVGEMNVLIDEADLQFYLAAMLARSGVSLAGGMRAVTPWVAPFGVEWLTLRQVILRIGITPTGSVALGFAGAAVIGTKDIDVAMAIAVSPVGVPTNFMIRGASEAGVGLADLATVQAGMAAARDRAAGTTGIGGGAPLIPLDALPDIEIRSLELQFAPRADVELGIERGFKVKGRLWLPTGPGGALTNFAGVDVNVSDEGVWIRGDLAAFQVGPLTWDDATIDLTATRTDQHLIVRGQVQLGLSRQLIDLSITRDALRFRSETELFGLFHATLSAQAAFQLRNPSFAVDAVVSNDFGEFVQPILRDGILRFASTGGAIVTGAQNAAAAAQRVLDIQAATAAQLRAVLVTQRANAEAAWRDVEARAAVALGSANAARRARDAARNLWDGTPLRQPVLRAARYAEFVRLAAVFATRVTQHAALAAAADARRAILDAIPPVAQSVLLLAADAATAELRRLLTNAEANLNTLAARYDAIIAAIDAGADPFAIQYAEFHASLAVVQGGGAMSWLVRGEFVGRPFELRRQLDFGSLVQAVVQLLTGLMGS